MQLLTRPPAMAGGVARGRGLAEGSDRWLERRVTLIWGLLFFNGMAWLDLRMPIPIPQRWGQVVTMGSLGVALVLALMLNPRLVIRPQVVLTLYTLLACAALLSTVKGATGWGQALRSVRLCVFLAVLWLLTPLWGRRDMLLARCHLRVLVVVLGTVVVGAVLAPGYAYGTYGRLTGVVWPIWATAVAHYAAVTLGICAVLWMSGAMGRRPALPMVAIGIVMLVLTKTRTAAIALTGGLICAALSLFLARRRVRRLTTAAIVAAPVLLVALSPFVVSWFGRGQSAAEVSGLTGRRQVWDMLLAAPRSEFERWFGFGLSDKGFTGRAIDSTWLAAYQDTGLIGAGLIAAVLILLLVQAGFSKATPARALAIFLLVYCAINSYTEVGLADASGYLLDLIACGSLLAATPFRARAALE